jgi:hypothetical protein
LRRKHKNTVFSRQKKTSRIAIHWQKRLASIYATLLYAVFVACQARNEKNLRHDISGKGGKTRNSYMAKETPEGGCSPIQSFVSLRDKFLRFPGNVFPQFVERGPILLTVHSLAITQHLEFLRARDTLLQMVQNREQLLVADIGRGKHFGELGGQAGAIVARCFLLARLRDFDHERFNLDTGDSHNDYLYFRVTSRRNLTWRAIAEPG